MAAVGASGGAGSFERSYLAALRSHVKPGRRPRPGAARRLGIRARGLGIGTLDLARIHENALAVLAPLGAAGPRPRQGRGAGAASFFAEAVAPLGSSRRPANGAGEPPGREGMEEAPDLGAGELASAEGRPTRGTGRRGVAREALAVDGAENRLLIERGAEDLASAEGKLTRETGRRRVAQNALAANRAENRVLLERGAVELASAQGLLVRETDRRRVAQEALTASQGELLDALERSRAMEAELRQLSRDLLAVQEEERKRISRELHDSLGQTLAAVNVSLASLNGAATGSKGLEAKVARTQRLVRKSMRTVHEFARHLRPALLDDLGLVPALLAFVKDFGKRHGVRASVAAAGTSSELDGDRRTAMFRVAQEALVNVGRHAEASTVRVTLRRTAGRIRLEVWNDGAHFDVKRALHSTTNRHLGLLCMRERMEMVGGTFSVRSSRKAGTTVRADIPLPIGNGG